MKGRTKAFHQRVREGYLKLAAAEPERWLVIDATKSKEEIAGIIWERVSQLLPRKREFKRGCSPSFTILPPLLERRGG